MYKLARATLPFRTSSNTNTFSILNPILVFQKANKRSQPWRPNEVPETMRDEVDFIYETDKYAKDYYEWEVNKGNKIALRHTFKFHWDDKIKQRIIHVVNHYEGGIVDEGHNQYEFYDTDDYALTRKHIFLRRRNGLWEIKAPIPFDKNAVHPKVGPPPKPYKPLFQAVNGEERARKILDMPKDLVTNRSFEDDLKDRGIKVFAKFNTSHVYYGWPVKHGDCYMETTDWGYKFGYLGFYIASNRYTDHFELEKQVINISLDMGIDISLPNVRDAIEEWIYLNDKDRYNALVEEGVILEEDVEAEREEVYKEIEKLVLSDEFVEGTGITMDDTTTGEEAEAKRYLEDLKGQIMDHLRRKDPRMGYLPNQKQQLEFIKHVYSKDRKSHWYDNLGVINDPRPIHERKTPISQIRIQKEERIRAKREEED